MRLAITLFTVILGLTHALTVHAARNLQIQSDSARYALVIGNNNYKHVNRLEKADNDAAAMGKALEKIGYQTTVLLDADRRQMNTAINRFIDDITGGGEGVLFFAGHGVQINNQNYLLPVDLDIPHSEADVGDQAINLQGVQDKIAQAHARFTLLVLDACRDNPLPRKAGRSMGATRGLAQPSSAEGQMVIFSAGANQQALDKLYPDDRDPNGVFTRELLPWLNKPGATVRQAVQAVRRAVYDKAKSVNHDQFPAVYDQVLGDFYFIPEPAKPDLIVVVPAVTAVPKPDTMVASIPPTAERRARSTLAFAALGLPINRRFWSGATRDSYTRQMHDTLQKAGSEVMRMDTRELAMGQAEFDTWWNESNQHPRSRELCAIPPAPRALLAARVESPTALPTAYSTTESAYWPELHLRLVNCANLHVYRQGKTLAPHNEDAWPFATELNSEIERFMRTGRDELSD